MNLKGSILSIFFIPLIITVTQLLSSLFWNVSRSFHVKAVEPEVVSIHLMLGSAHLRGKQAANDFRLKLRNKTPSNHLLMAALSEFLFLPAALRMELNCPVAPDQHSLRDPVSDHTCPW